MKNALLNRIQTPFGAAVVCLILLAANWYHWSSKNVGTDLIVLKCAGLVLFFAANYCVSRLVFTDLLPSKTPFSINLVAIVYAVSFVCFAIVLSWPPSDFSAWVFVVHSVAAVVLFFLFRFIIGKRRKDYAH